MLRGLRVIRKEATEKDKESSCNFIIHVFCYNAAKFKLHFCCAFFQHVPQ